MSADPQIAGSLVVLWSQDVRLAQTRHWVLEQAGFSVQTVSSLADLYATADRSTVAVFLLCNSLSAEQRAEATHHIREHWKDAKLLIFVPSYPLPTLPADEFFPAMEGPGRLVQTVQKLLSAS